ncbi:MAG: phosphate/phosphite/phosphonate ABC transporter substrate-binding protein [Xanthomonadales bacterium]|nr:phosphate/phosphite/phosphonate ABC transporter substrate-binding protein [Xanthomonadales bacterium]
MHPIIRSLCLLLLLLPGYSRAQAEGLPEHPVLVLGRVSDDPRRDAEKLQPMLDYVVPRMRSVGVRSGRILMARDAAQMQSYLRRKRVDWVSDTAIMAIDYRRRAGASILLVTERGGGIDYYSVFFTWRGSGITSLDDLKGRSIAFQNSYSTSSYVLPAAEILRNGLALDVLLSPFDRASPGRVGYVFARSEGNIQTWVRKRVVDAGAYSNLDWDKGIELEPTAAQDLVIFHDSRQAPRALEVVAGDLEPAVRARLREVLLAAAEDPQAQEALGRFFGTQAFLPMSAEVDRSLNQLQKDLDFVREHLE